MHLIMNIPKDDAKSIAFRTTGNLHFAKNNPEDFLIALKFYNKAICFAPNNSENLCIAYANRSAVYFQMEMFEECLVNINMVYKINNYPNNLWDKLKQRENKCKAIISEDNPYDDEWKEPKLNFPPHDNVPYIANCLEMRRNQQYGNHIVTNRDLKVGEIVGILKPFCTATARRYQYERCENCCAERSQNLIPCSSCTAVMFCDEKCLREATDGFHKYECVAIDLINKVIPHQQDKLTLRVITSGLSAFQNIDEFLDKTEKMLKKNVTIFDINHNNLNSCDGYAILSSLKKAATIETLNLDVLNLSVICDKIFTASNITSKKNPKEVKKMIHNIVKQHLLMVEKNGHMFDDLSYHIVNKRSPSYNEKDMDNNMSGLYPFMSMLPHSCVPNILCSSSRNGKIVSAVRPIKAGEILFHSGL